MLRFLIGFVLAAFLLCGCGSQSEPLHFDLVIENAQVIDGTGAERYAADIGVVGDTIARIGTISLEEKATSLRRIDGAGLVVSPGFIDVHTHSDFSLLVDGTAQSKVRQGVTTEVLGESLSAGPIAGRAPRSAPFGLEVDWNTLGEYFDRLQRQGISVNVASFVGATQVRLCVLGEDSRDPKPAEMDEMKRLVREAMSDGALGLSCALLVPPNTYHTTEQLAAMAAETRPFGGIYSTHIRTEGEGIEGAINEALEVGRKAGVPVDIIHLKVADRRLWGSMPKVCDLIERARSSGLQVTANQYPYVAGQNDLVALVPPWAMEGGRPEMMKRLGDRGMRARMAKDILQGVPGWFDHYLAIGEWKGCVVASVGREENKPFEGKSIAEIAAMRGQSPTDAVFDLLLAEEGSVPAVYFLMDEEDVRYAMKRPWVSVGSDGSAVRPDGPLGEGKPHPRWYGTFPRILGRYVREEQVLTLEEAVRKITSLNAEKLGMTERGVLAAGKKADITLFDPERVIDRATFTDPHQYPVGIEYVIVNGVPVIERSEHTGQRPGRVLRKNSGSF